MYKLLSFLFVLKVSCSDGVAREGRIIGGFPSPIKNYPYQLSLMQFWRHICGAVLISDRTALSAAHCVLLPPQSYQLRCGSSFVNRGGIVMTVVAIKIHPMYNRLNGDYDLSVIFLPRSLVLGPTVAPVRLPKQYEKIVPGQRGTVTGWGYFMSTVPTTSSILRSADVFVIDLESCKRSYPPFSITDRMFCAGTLDGDRDACLGDSGGGLVVQGMLVGVVSWGVSCGQAGFPGVYTNVAILRDFLSVYAKV